MKMRYSLADIRYSQRIYNGDKIWILFYRSKKTNLFVYIQQSI